MAIAQEGTPIGGGKLSPVYNPIIWYFGSGLVNLPGFRYVVEIKETNTSDLISTLEIPPRPIDGLCVADIGRILSNYVTNQLPTDAWGIDATDSYLEYELEVRERYNVSYGWTGYSESTTSTEYPIYTQLLFDSPTPFAAGDQIINFVSNPSLEPLLDGILTVIDVIDSSTIVVNRKWSVLNQGAVINGDVIFADGRKFTSDVELTVTGSTAWNGALSHIQLKDYSVDDYLLSAVTPSKLLTNIPQDSFRVRENTVLGVLAYNDGTTGRRLVISDGTTTKFRTLNSSGKEIIYLPVGPGNLDEPAFTLFGGPNVPITSSPSNGYSYWVATSAMVPVSEVYNVEFDYTCTKWDEYQLVFLDRLGSLGSFSFYYLNQETQDITRISNNYTIGDLDSGTWKFNVNERGFINTNVEVTDRIRLNTGWLSNEESQYIQELFSSPVVWLNLTNELWPVNIIDTSSFKNDKRSTKNIRYEITVEVANINVINW